MDLIIQRETSPGMWGVDYFYAWLLLTCSFKCLLFSHGRPVSEPIELLSLTRHRQAYVTNGDHRRVLITLSTRINLQ